MDSLARLVVVLVLAVGGQLAGCAHTIVIEADPIDAIISVDGEEVGAAPVQVERTVFFGDQLRVSAQREGYEPLTVSVPASEWYPWPGFMAIIPLLGLPISLPALLIPFAGPFVAAAIAVSWAVITSPALLSLALTRKYPDSVTVTMQRKKRTPENVLTPTDLFGPDDLGANPIPDVGQHDDPKKTEPGPEPPAKTPTKPPPGANPVP